jgi:Zn finger protein HypA/HybF involved in hydrogenase expression|tara:strand:- start:223 stop:402 length:180 start_codon:yes stop_codon:yes gene_type:complete
MKDRDYKKEYDYYNTSKPDADKDEKKKDRKCNLCSKVVPMTRFERFCPGCRRRANELQM